MSILKILHYPDKKLREKAQPVTKFDAELEQTVNDLIETMYAGDGVGLAATQVGLDLRIFVMDVSENNDSPEVFINPDIYDKQGSSSYQEGCLSFPGVYAKVDRAKQISVKYQDIKGEFHDITVTDLKCVCIQHETDHLDGIVFVDYLSKLKRNRLLKKLEKLQKIANL